MRRRRLSRLFPPLLGVLLLGISLWAIDRELSQYEPRQIWQSLTAISKQDIVLAIVLTLLNCGVFASYDVLAIKQIRHPLPWYKAALVGAISIPVTNTVGFALLSGSAIRYRFYSPWGLSASQIARVIAFCNISFWLGLFVVGGIVFVIQPVNIPRSLHLPFQSVRPIGVIFLSAIAAYVGWNGIEGKPLKIGSWRIPRLSLRLCLAQLAIASLDWTLAAAVFYALLPDSPSISYGFCFSIYLLAQLAGIVSNVPAGLGVFETIVLLLLSHTFASVVVFGSLLAYRAVYYLLPVTISSILLGIYEVRHHFRRRCS